MRGHILCRTKAIGAAKAAIEWETGSLLEWYDGYKLRMGDALWNYGYLYGRGSFTIRTRSGAASNAFFERQSGQGVWMDFVAGPGERILLQRLGQGTSSTAAFSWGGGPGSTAVKYVLEGALAEDCGIFIRCEGSVGGAIITRLVDVTAVNGTQAYDVHLGGLALTTGESLIQNVRLENGFEVNHTRTGFTFNNVLAGNLGVSSRWGGVGAPAAATDVTVVSNNAQPFSTQCASTMVRPTVIVASSVSNVKAIQLPATDGATQIDDATVVPLGATSSDGEYINASTSPSGQTVIFNRPVFGPHKDGSGMRSLEFLTNNTNHVYIYHGTMPAYTASCGIGHTGHSVTTADRGRIISSILAIFDNSTNRDVAGWISNDVADCFDGAGFTHNAKTTLWGSGSFRAGRYAGSSWPVGYNYNDSTPSDAPGANDITANPWPAWSSMSDLPSLAKFATSCGITGADDAEREAKAVNAMLVDNIPTHADYVAGCTHTAFAAYYRGEFVVRNAALNGAAHDGGVIGAMGYEAPASSNNYTMPGVGIGIGMGIGR